VLPIDADSKLVVPHRRVLNMELAEKVQSSVQHATCDMRHAAYTFEADPASVGSVMAIAGDLLEKYLPVA
jgi:hypothetical protein